MNSNKLAWIFAGLSTVLLVVSIILVLQIDRTDPEIRFEDINLIYSPDMDIRNLYEGVAAYDEKDGDLTDQIVIEKIVSSTDGKSVSVTYAVIDSSNNFNKKVRVFPQKEIEDSASHVALDENNMEETQVTDDIENTNENEQETETEEENQEDEDLSEEEDQEDDITDENEEDNQSHQDETTNETDSQSESSANNQETQVGESPILELSKKEVTVKVGIRPAWVEIIKKLTDDKDDYDTLYRNLVLGGEYDDSKIGDYEVTLRTVDSDNNRSETSKIIIHVVE